MYQEKRQKLKSLLQEGEKVTPKAWNSEHDALIKEQKKKEEAIEAKTDTSKFEKLKEKKVEEYNKAAAKEEESFIEEFVIRGLGET